MSNYTTAPMPPAAPQQYTRPAQQPVYSTSSTGAANSQPHFQPQIAPWTQYMRSSNGSAAHTLPSIVNPNAQVSIKANPANTAPIAPITKRHNPYAASASDSGSAITSPALAFQAASQVPNPLNFDRVPSSNFSNNNSLGMYPQSSRGTDNYHQNLHHGSSGSLHHTSSANSAHHQGHSHTSRGNHGERNNGERAQGNRQITADDVRQQKGSLLDLAHTANGSAFLQSAIRGNSADTMECIELISAELLPHLGDLLLDSHGCYIIKTLMERMPTEQLQQVMIKHIAPDESLVYSLCTHSLHTRRVVQFLLDTIDCSFLIATITSRCSEIATTQQGCIVVQRAMDVAVGAQRQHLFSTIQSHFNTFCFDPFANYVLQHMFSVGDAADVGRGVWPQIRGNVIALSCNKFASNVVEKCLSNLPGDLQHDLLHEMYDVPEERLLGMLQDSFGNYIVQTSIALAPQKEIPFMRTKLMAVLDRTPYGHKIETRLERRRKVNGHHTNSAHGKGGENGANSASSNPNNNHHNNNSGNHHQPRPNSDKAHHSHRGRPQKVNITPVAPVAEGEEPWE